MAADRPPRGAAPPAFVYVADGPQPPPYPAAAAQPQHAHAQAPPLPPPPFNAVEAKREQNARVVQRKDYQYILVVDRSGSMGSFNDCPGGATRWDYALECAQSFVSKCVRRQGSPMKLVLFSSKAKLLDGVTADQLPSIWEEHEPYGGTNMADAVQMALDEHFKAAGKKHIVVVITDGAPDNREALANVIVDATHRMRDDAELGLQFIQIGKDPKAAEFLAWLDVALQEDDPTDATFAEAQRLKKAVGIVLRRYAKFDIVDTTPSEGVEEKGGLDKVLDMAVSD
jgi:hypothetical protein